MTDSTSYELDHRIHCSRLYPLSAPNGSTILLYGHDTGIRILWRGGRRPRNASSSNASHSITDGISNNADVEMEGEDGGGVDAQGRYEAGDEAQDPECPYPDVVAELNLDLETEVLHVAVPSFAPSIIARLPDLAKTHMIIALACADTTMKLMIIPLAPPAPGTHQEYLDNEVREIQLEDSRAIPRDLTIKLVLEDRDPSADVPQSQQERDQAATVIIASIGSLLSVWSWPVPLHPKAALPRALIPYIQTPVTGSHVCFQVSPRLNDLLVAEASGVVRILGFHPMQVSHKDDARWIMSYQTPFHAPENSTANLARRKKILSAVWILGGRGILVLLEDGQWGIWDLSANSQSAGRSVQEFALHGFLSTSSTDSTTQSSQKKSTGSKLAPMTPNTRKQKSENLFAGPPKPSHAASLGGISVSPTTTQSGSADESIVLWYNNAIYSIPSMQAFWQRSTSNASGGDRNSFGGLYAPGLTHITDINLMNENVTSISQFVAKPTSPASALGQMNVQSDLLVSAEHRYIILQHIRPQIRSREQLKAATERPMSKDQRMLDVGEADLGGMNRILDGMADEVKVRRVGFAAS